eukprot:TRINITY_DN111763_c0_g1_i1.p1 TRINITY_DN111763_c0_g1~~TRINITY_DN111763_c0_g1_i1.p1  ORF type:complete len:341 (-),score=57.62 TRINITY_DN111763_c0_g1_i1:68-1090(-)
MKAGNFSQSADEVKLYGALLDQELAFEQQQNRNAKWRKRINGIPLILALMLPWAMYNISFAVAAFYFHYKMPLTSVLFQVAVVLACLCFLPGTYKGRQLRPEEGFFPFYINVAILVASVLGWACGDFCFWSFTLPAYRGQNMASYSQVDPSMETLPTGEVVPSRGSRFQDAGKVYFTHDAVLDMSRIVTFKQGSLYCAAPIYNPKCRENCGHDFWAVGLDCCAEDGSNFRCGDAGNKKAKSGLRMVEDANTAYYRLAVIQAAGKMKIFSPHPIFFDWLVDPVAEIHSLTKMSYRRFLICMFASFAINAAVCATMLSGFRKAMQKHAAQERAAQNARANHA